MTDTGDSVKTAALILIGDEILSGRTEDKNLSYLARWLGDLGIELKEARVIADDTTVIADTVNALRREYDYVFTTGGIGPTHDDVTIEAVAAAFGKPLKVHEEARARMEAYHGKEGVNEGRLRMITLPEGCTLIDNTVGAAPGFQLENVFVMAGIPNVMQAMLEAVRPRLEAATPYTSLSIRAHLPESTLSAPLRELQAQYPDVRIGSYPFYEGGKPGADLVIRSRNPDRAAEVAGAARAAVRRLSGDSV